MKNMLKLAAVLAAYAVVACVGLAFVYNVTSPLIAEAAARETKAALQVVFPAADDFEDVTGKVSSDEVVFERAYVAKKDGAALGMVIQTIGTTYKSSTIMVGVDMNRALLPIRFMANSDTPGLGTKTMASPFTDQFTAKSADDAFKPGSDVQAIAGATISSKGVFRIVRAASAAAAEYLEQNHGGSARTAAAAQ